MEHYHEYSPGKRPTSAELLELFPEARQIVPRLIKEMNAKLSGIKTRIKEIYEATDLDGPTKYLAIQFVRISADQEDLKTLKRLRSLNALMRPKTYEGFSVEQAKEIKIQDVHAFGKIRTFGKKIKALCPFHEEKTPSFYIFTDTNSFHCFGCQTGGDVIKFVQVLHKLSFKDALEFLRKL